MSRDGRVALQSVGRERLALAGRRLVRAREQIAAETEDISLLLDGFLSSGISVAEAADLIGMSRQSVYDLRRRGIERQDGLEKRVLAHLAAGGAATVAGLAERVHSDEDTVRAAVDTLQTAQLISKAVMQYGGGAAEAWYRVSDAGVAALEEWVWRTRDRPQLWAVYVPMLGDERAALERVALDVFGPEWFAVIEPGTVRDQTQAELAFNVTSESFDGAIEQAKIRVAELYRAAGVEGGWAIRTILPGDSWRAEFGSGA